MPGNAILSGLEREHKEERNKAWINNYPRRILDFMTPNELFLNELKAIS